MSYLLVEANVEKLKQLVKNIEDNPEEVKDKIILQVKCANNGFHDYKDGFDVTPLEDWEKE